MLNFFFLSGLLLLLLPNKNWTMAIRLGIASQNSDRLNAKSTKLLSDYSICYDINQRTLLASAQGLSIDIIIK